MEELPTKMITLQVDQENVFDYESVTPTGSLSMDAIEKLIQREVKKI